MGVMEYWRNGVLGNNYGVLPASGKRARSARSTTEKQGGMRPRLRRGEPPACPAERGGAFLPVLISACYSDSTPSRSDPADVRGSALIVVLWVIGLLSMLVTSFAFDAHLEAKITSYYRKRTKASYLARSGIEIARLLMAHSTTVNPRSEADAERSSDPWYADSRRLAGGDGVSLEREYETGTIKLDIVSERARRNVNYLKTEEEWEPVLEVADIPEELWPQLIESFLDWTDNDDTERVDGAETDEYYAELEPPYKARNGPLDTVEEMLLIKGFSRAIVEGGVLDPEADEPIIVSGLKDLLTTFGDKRINVNSASRRVLMTLPDPNGDADLVAENIIAEREEGGVAGIREDSYFLDDSDLFRRVPGLGIAQRREYVTTASSKFFRITSRGIVGNVERKVWCIAEVQGMGIKMLRWEEED